MAVWKQLILGLVVLVIGAALWIGFVPGSRDLLARWGVDLPAFAAVQPASSPSQSAGSGGGNGGGGGRGGGGRGGPTTVVTAPVTRATINDRLSAIGTGNAIRSVTVLPFVPGRLVEILVSSGDRIAAGDVIARLDAQAEEIAVARANISLENAQAALERATALLNSRTVTAVTQTDAQLVVQNAELELQQAQLALERRSIVAPIAGIVGILPVELGDYVTSQTEIATLDDRSEILVDFWVAERLVNSVQVGAAVEAGLVARPDMVFTGTVSALDSRIDEASRTMRVQARIANPDDYLRAGMSFQVRMNFPGETYPAVDPLAVQWSTEGAFVWQVREAKAARVPVRIIQRNTDAVLVDADLPENGVVVTEGLQALRDGAAVQIAGNPQGQPVATTQAPGEGS